MKIYARGSFGFTPVVGLTPHHWPPRNHENLYMGLPPAGQHMWASLEVDGRRVVPIRQTQNELAVRFLLFEGEPGADLGLASKTPGFAGIADVETRDGRWGLFQPGSHPRFAFATGEDAVLWRETNEMELTGTPLGHAIQLAIPDAEEPFGYRARFWTVDGGTRDGKPVRGVVGHEQVYLRPGGGWFTSRYMDDLEQVWIVFVTEFDDGSTLHGHLAYGKENYRFAAVQRSDGTSVTSSVVSCECSFDDDGFPESITFDVGPGSRFVYTAPAAGGGRMRLPEGPKWREGLVTEAGEQRSVRFSHAWAEAFPERL